MTKRVWKAGVVTVVLAAAALVSAVLAQADNERGHAVRGGGTSIISGGTGAPGYVPVLTKVAFNWSGESGRFDCLALAPSTPTGPKSGEFDANAMYVTGAITSARVSDSQAVLKGTATVTGLGAGSNQAFTLTVARGGPGATVVLEVSNMTFHETLLEGTIDF